MAFPGPGYKPPRKLEEMKRNIKSNLTKKEIKAILSCIIITEDSINNNVLMVRLFDKKVLKNIDLNNLYIKVCDGLDE